MPTNQELEIEARKQAREVLSKQPNFSQLDREQQFEQYKSLVSTLYNQLVEQERAKEIQRKDGQLAAQQSFSGAMAAGDLINKNDHLNQRIEQEGRRAGDTLREVDFPKFVKDLLKSVFDANLQVTKDQMESYALLVEKITQPVANLIKEIDDADAQYFLTQTNNNQYKIIMDELTGKPKLRTSDGQDLDDEDQQMAINTAKMQMATQKQRFLQEMLLMGVNRMVVDSGTVRASLHFNIKATEDIKRADVAQQNDNKNSTTDKTLGASGNSIFTSLLGGIVPSGKYTDHSLESHLMVSNSNVKSTSNTVANTDITGEVEIKFKSDYFKLDNFKEILQPSGQQSQPQKSPGANSSNGTPNGTAPEPATVSNTGSDNGDS